MVSEPIKNQANRTIGVLTIYGDQDDGLLTLQEGVEECKALAESIGRILIDVCGLETDAVTANQYTAIMAKLSNSEEDQYETQDVTRDDIERSLDAVLDRLTRGKSAPPAAA